MRGREHSGPVTPPLPPLALLSSPLLGPAVWAPVSQVLTGLGWDVHLVPGPASAPRDGAEMLTHLIAHLPAGADLAVAAHSNAGLYLPALTGVRHLLASVYVDAALPAADGPVPLAPPRLASFVAALPAADGPVPLAPPRLASFVAALAGPDGLLPPWTRWWDEADVASLFPDTATRAEVERQQQRLPADYFTSTIDAPSGWMDRPAAYLAFGDGYQAERRRAANWGWPAQTIAHARHLHGLIDPPAVGTHIDDLLRHLLDNNQTAVRLSARPSSAPRPPSR